MSRREVVNINDIRVSSRTNKPISGGVMFVLDSGEVSTVREDAETYNAIDIKAGTILIGCFVKLTVQSDSGTTMTVNVGDSGNDPNENRWADTFDLMGDVGSSNGYLAGDAIQWFDADGSIVLTFAQSGDAPTVGSMRVYAVCCRP